jgi:thymidine phosphorylase
LAEGIDGLTLDVKTDAGAFLPNREESLELARMMVALGERRGVRTTALVTSMAAPLGRAVGNGLETREALQCLGGEGPSDLADLSAILTGEMLYLGGMADSPEAGRSQALEALAAGRGLSRMARLIELQGGDPRVIEDPVLVPCAPAVATLPASKSGHVNEISPVDLGYGVVELGGGRRRMGDDVDLGVGFVLKVGVGDEIQEGAPLGEVYAADSTGLEKGLRILEEAVSVRREPQDSTSGGLVLERVSASS